MTYVCITGNENDPRALQERIDQVLRTHSRLVCELRLDYLDLSPGATFSFLAKLPSEWAPRLVLTQRLRASGVTAQGRCGWDVPTWQSWWKDVMSLRPWFAVDLDWIVLDRLNGEGLTWQGQFSGRHAFFSLHAPLDELELLAPELAASARTHGAGIKIASTVRGPRDLMRLTRISDSVGEFPLKTVVAMGAAGKAWRWSQLAGSLSYFCVDETSNTADGQDTMPNVLPFLETKRRPDLFLLWSNDPNNKKGERRWNELFQTRGTYARYLNLPCSDEPKTEEDEIAWSQDALLWMTRAGVVAASVTRPFKRVFAAALGGSSAINTLRVRNEKYEKSNTDGDAVASILEDFGMLGEPVAILGGGGAAQAVQDDLVKRGVLVAILRRNEAGEPPQMHNEKILISTWPGTNQQFLVEWLKRCASPDLKLCIDAQFSLPASESPLAAWCAENKIQYVAGDDWWKRQALGQDLFWFSSEERWGKVRVQLFNLIPTSKSMTLRALALGAIRGGKTKILNPSICKDTQVFRRALLELGVKIDEEDDSWKITPPSQLRAPEAALHLGEGAMGFRLLLALASVMQGKALRMDAADSLRARPHDEIFSALGITATQWPLDISLPTNQPKAISTDRSSQFATSVLIAAAAQSRRTGLAQQLFVSGGQISEPYLNMTLTMLREAGFGLENKDGGWIISNTERTNNAWDIFIEPDASSVSFLQVITAKLSLDIPFISSIQGDAVFAVLLNKLLSGESVFSLRDFPDLAPPLVAAALLFHKDIFIRDCKHLRYKESDRIQSLLHLAHSLGVTAEETPDGLQVKGSTYHQPRNPIQLQAFSDHRLAMTAGVLGFFAPEISVDDPKCVEKSFPEFWHALQLLKGICP